MLDLANNTIRALLKYLSAVTLILLSFFHDLYLFNEPFLEVCPDLNFLMNKERMLSSMFSFLDLLQLRSYLVVLKLKFSVR